MRMPAVSVELASFTNADPFHTPTMLHAVILGEVMSMVIGSRNVPGYLTPLMLTPTPTPATTVKPGVVRDVTEVRRRKADLHIRGEGPRGNVHGDAGTGDANRPDGPPGRGDGLAGDYLAEPAGRQWIRHWRRYGLAARRGRGCDAGRSQCDRRAEHDHYE